MRTRRTHRLVAMFAAVAMLATACGGDDEAATEDESDGGNGGNGEESAAQTPGEDAEGVQELADGGTIRVGIKYDQPLFGVNTPDGVGGFDPEIAKLMVEGIFDDGEPASHIEWVETVSANREPFLEGDEVDMVIATYTMNDERDEVVDFAGPYYFTGQQMLVPEGNPMGIETIEDANSPDVSGCSATGSTSIQQFRETAPEAEVLELDTYSQCAQAMVDGRTDLVTTDGAILFGLRSQFEGTEVVGETFSDEPYGIGVSEGADDLRLYLNSRICQIQNNGEWVEAWEATVGEFAETPDPPPFQTERYDQIFAEGSECAGEGGAGEDSGGEDAEGEDAEGED